MTDFSWGGYFQAIALMCLLLGLLWLGLWALRRFGKLRMLPNSSALPKNALLMEMQLPLGPRKGLVVVQFLHKRLLLGVTEQQITLLQELDMPSTPEVNSKSNLPNPEPNLDSSLNARASAQPDSSFNARESAQPNYEPDLDPKPDSPANNPVSDTYPPKTSPTNPEALDFAKVLQNAQ